MQWWAWIAVGAMLLGSELTFVNAQFYLVFVGAAALVVGLPASCRARSAAWLQWSLFARPRRRCRWSVFGGGSTSACAAQFARPERRARRARP